MSCERENEILRAIAARQWPERCDAELRAHAASCTECADLVEVATALTEERDAAVAEAHLPSSGAVWWRAQLRARQDAARLARRVISFVQAAAVAAAVVAAAIIVYVSGGGVWIAQAIAAVHWPLPVLLALATPLILAPVAVYFAVTRD